MTDLLQYVTDLDQIDFEFKRLGQVNYEKRRRSIFIVVFNYHNYDDYSPIKYLCVPYLCKLFESLNTLCKFPNIIITHFLQTVLNVRFVTPKWFLYTLIRPDHIDAFC